MATVYKVEIEVVSEWINYPPEEVEKIIKEKIGNTHPILRQQLQVTEIKAERTS